MILPPATLGMLGGGQLGRFFVSAAHEMGYQVWVLDPDPHSPAGLIADRHLVAEYTDYVALDDFASGCAAVTTEFENVPAATLEYLTKFVPVRPGALAVAVCQSRFAEKQLLVDHGLPHGPFLMVNCEDDLRDAGPELFPAILKVARLGYDGKGQARVADRDEALHAYHQFHNEPCLLEKRLELDAEVSVVLARDEAGNTCCFPVVENRHRNGILDVSIAPATVSDALQAQARALAERIADHLGYVGTLAVEFFISGGQLVINEMAPRPHNSGHHTLDACVTSQYEQQVRALAGLSLGEATQHTPAVMVNLLGDLWYDGEHYREPDWSVLHAVPGLKLHLYAKHHARHGRKMGHFTVLDTDPALVLQRALQARAAIGIADQ